MNKLIICKLILVCSFFISCNGQTKEIAKPNDKIVGGGCDGCELMYMGCRKKSLQLIQVPVGTKKGKS
jgi:protocatechuate 3,4-dioxygenase beta subunit